MGILVCTGFRTVPQLSLDNLDALTTRSSLAGNRVPTNGVVAQHSKPLGPLDRLQGTNIGVDVLGKGAVQGEQILRPCVPVLPKNSIAA